MSHGSRENTSGILEFISPELKQGFDALNFTEYYKKTLFFTSEIKKVCKEQKYPILFVLEKAKKANADAVLFKLFNNRPPKPEIYIYDFTSSFKSEEELGEIHKTVWNTGEVPLIYIFTKTEIKIINCMRHPIGKDGKILPSYLDKGILNDAVSVNKVLKKYSASLFYNGSFWEEKNNENIFSNETAAELLLKNLTVLRQTLLKKSELKTNIKVINKLLIQCILLKYLEERKDRDDKPVFPSDYFKKFNNATSLCDVLCNGNFLELCDSLETKFNGKIFQWVNTNERKLLHSIKLKEIADFLYAKQDISGQSWLWRLYSFNFLPVELISHIYDHFLGEHKKGKVYTPIHLANLLIDESMPLNISDIPDLQNYKILDPSCGSGVFLVLAFKRLVQWWTIENYKKTGKWAYPKSNTIKRLIRNCLYGIDIDAEAVQLAVFSISLALCDMLSPPEIWDELKFEDLTNNNILEMDFFKYLKTNTGKFNLIIGNPPFVSKLETEDAKQIEDNRINKLQLPKTPDKQLAFLFMEQSIKLLEDDKNSLLCLLIPAAFLYSNANEYRRYVLESNIAQIIDFSHISDTLFPNVLYPVLGIFIKNNDTVYDKILHIVIKRTRINKQKVYFEIDDYDLNLVDKKTVMEDDSIWKCNFLGGGRIYPIVMYLKQERTLGSYLEDKRKNKGWYFAEGYIVGHSKKKNDQELEKILYRNRKRYSKADYITGKPTVDTKFFTEKGINEDGIKIEEEKYFEWPRNKKLYDPPHLLIKENIGKKSIPIILNNEYLTFRNEIIGIHASYEDIAELKKIENRIRDNQIYRFYITCISSRSGILKSNFTILEKDIMNLPYPEDEKQLLLSDSEETVMNDVLNYMIKAQSIEGENELSRKVNKDDLEKFSYLYCKTLNSVYQDNDKIFKQDRIIRTPAFICNSFIYGEESNNTSVMDELEESEKKLQELIFNQTGESLYINRIIRIYDKDIIYLIKPDQLRYWLGSIALKDADKTFADLLKDGY